ncbi:MULTISPECIES: metalloregulator ArsR/SmtB family transcription factor [Pediococcus]|uniref:ArsR/SmtB family transcription factor n=1 Tax=Pediococcus TaxID=1253 RepID=UPI000E9E8046|nr:MULTISPECIES: metalloregulator ArsR/SmtB family transcription factor [Pediococcus]MCT3030005.1 ArsR family transcriptional regulator [Pediococcus parvulus]MCT3035000.1 ArsR family transcriptional regulator [Pediococcus parvulus]HBO46753.1 transcriptional regulator [Pediococcus sp.]
MAEQSMKILKKSAPIFAMLQDENRQQILLMLCAVDKLTVNQITEQLELSRPAVSHHLKLLLDAGLVTVTRAGTERYYTVHLNGAIDLLKQLTASLEADLNQREMRY